MFELRLVPSVRAEQKLTTVQKTQLTYLLTLSLELRHPEYPHAVRGLEGMKTGHAVLQEKGAAGVLIGGLAEEVWGGHKKPENLASHKDVDIAIIGDSIDMPMFEGGVDWWLPHEKHLALRDEHGGVSEANYRYWENGYGVRLSFGIKAHEKMKPGLYIPGRGFVTDMRWNEALAYVPADKEIDENVYEKFGDRIERRVGSDLPKFLQREFREYVLDARYNTPALQYALEVVRFDRSLVMKLQPPEKTSTGN